MAVELLKEQEAEFKAIIGAEEAREAAGKAAKSGAQFRKLRAQRLSKNPLPSRVLRAVAIPLLTIAAAVVRPFSRRLSNWLGLGAGLWFLKGRHNAKQARKMKPAVATASTTAAADRKDAVQANTAARVAAAQMMEARGAARATRSAEGPVLERTLRR